MLMDISLLGSRAGHFLILQYTYTLAKHIFVIQFICMKYRIKKKKKKGCEEISSLNLNSEDIWQIQINWKKVCEFGKDGV